MQDHENKTDKTTKALVGFVCGVLTVIVIYFLIK